MRKFTILFISIIIVLAWASKASSQVLAQQTDGRDPVFEQEILDRLNAIDPQAGQYFQAGTQAYDTGDFEASKSNFEQVLALAPDFPDALRRLSYAESALENFQDALALAERAYQVDPSPYNQVAIARALINLDDSASYQRALTLAQAAVEAMPDELDALLALDIASAVNERSDVLRTTNAHLLELFPNQSIGHYFAGLLAAQDRQWETAERELLLAQRLGFSADAVQEILDGGIRAQAIQSRWLRRGGISLVGWFVGFFVLFGVGGVLSWATLRAVRRPNPAREYRLTPGEAWIRAVYRIVIGLTTAYFYISIPVLILLIIAAVGGILYLFLAMGQIPVKLAVIIIITAIYTLVVVIRSLFIRIQEGERGRSLPRSEAPDLWALAEEVARRVGTRPVDAIYLIPGTGIAVTERGGFLKKVSGQGQRCLILGVGALDGLNQGAFKAILAHEYGHFSNKDTAGGNLANQVQVSISLMGYGLAANRLANFYNPAWLFVQGFYRIFLRITLGARRLQEILADRYAVMAYGAQNFIEGLTHVVRQSITFDAKVNQEINTQRHLHNLYQLPALSPEHTTQLEGNVEKALTSPTSAYDSHPGVRERIELVRQLSTAPVQHDWSDASPTWELFPSPESIQQEMTAVIQAYVDRQRNDRNNA